MTAIDALVGGAARARASFDAAAIALSSAGLPTAPDDPTAPAPGPDEPPLDTGVDVAEQMVTMMLASRVHSANIAVLRSALDMYAESLDLVRR